MHYRGGRRQSQGGKWRGGRGYDTGNPKGVSGKLGAVSVVCPLRTGTESLQHKIKHRLIQVGVGTLADGYHNLAPSEEGHGISPCNRIRSAEKDNILPGPVSKALGKGNGRVCGNCNLQIAARKEVGTSDATSGHVTVKLLIHDCKDSISGAFLN